MTSTRRGDGLGSGGRMWMEEGVPCVRPQEKSEPTDIILSSSHAKKLSFFCTKTLSFDGIKSGIFSEI